MNVMADIKRDTEKRRIVVLTDISTLDAGSGEPDDTQSLIRLLLYADCFDIEGLIATYTKHFEGRVFPEYIAETIRRYGQVYPNLLKHSPDYPKPEALLQVVKGGSPVCGLENVGLGKDTEGSDWIIQVVDKEDVRPVWFTVWGGSLDLAQALWKVKTERAAEEFARFCSKIKVYSISDQYDTCGQWIRENCPGILYLTSYHSFRGMYRGGDESLVDSAWVREHIIEGHGALGECYPDYDGGDPWGAVKGIKEGDTPSFLYLIPNGLGVPECPECSSWGGSFVLKDGQYVDFGERAGVFRFRQAFQNDFLARLDLCVKDYEEANHPPVAVIKVSPKPGEYILLDASGSYDPDGDALHYRWWIDEAAGSGAVKAVLYDAQPEQMCRTQLRIASDSGNGEIHVVLEVTDCGMPPLSRYDRVVIQVQ